MALLSYIITTFLIMYVWMVTHVARQEYIFIWINRGYQSCTWSAEQGKLIFPCPRSFAPENLASRDGYGSPVPRQPAHLHTQAESAAYLRDSSRVPRRRPFIYFEPPYAIGSVPSLSDHATAYRWRSLPAESPPAQGQKISR